MPNAVILLAAFGGFDKFCLIWHLRDVIDAGKEIESVGGVKTISLDIRIIAATNRNLEEMVSRRGFREDLWFRLNVFPIWIPPFRERKGDIPALLQHFVSLKARL